MPYTSPIMDKLPRPSLDALRVSEEEQQLVENILESVLSDMAHNSDLVNTTALRGGILRNAGAIMDRLFKYNDEPDMQGEIFALLLRDIILRARASLNN